MCILPMYNHPNIIAQVLAAGTYAAAQCSMTRNACAVSAGAPLAAGGSMQSSGQAQAYDRYAGLHASNATA